MKKYELIIILKELRKISGECHLFGTFGSELPVAINKKYKMICDLLIKKGFLDTEMFTTGENCSAEEIYTDISLLISYMDETE